MQPYSEFYSSPSLCQHRLRPHFKMESDYNIIRYSDSNDSGHNEFFEARLGYNHQESKTICNCIYVYVSKKKKKLRATSKQQSKSKMSVHIHVHHESVYAYARAKQGSKSSTVYTYQQDVHVRAIQDLHLPSRHVKMAQADQETKQHFLGVHMNAMSELSSRLSQTTSKQLRSASSTDNLSRGARLPAVRLHHASY